MNNQTMLDHLHHLVLKDRVKLLSTDLNKFLCENSEKQTLYAKAIDVLQKFGIFNWPTSISINSPIPKHIKTLILHNWIPTGPELLKKWNYFTKDQKIWHFINNINEIPQCTMCSNFTRLSVNSYKGVQLRYTQHCSNRCRALDPNVEKKRKITCKERYGQDKSFSNQMHLQKTRNALSDRWGVEFPLQHKDHLEKTRLIISKKYGQEYLSYIQSKSRATILEKYNQPTIGHALKQFGSKARQTRLQSWLPIRLKKIEQFVVPLYDLTRYVNKFQLLPYRCVKCNTEFESNLIIRTGTDSMTHVPRCPSCFPLNSTKWNQHQIVQFIKTFNIDVISNCRNIIPPQELDLFFPKRSIAIEYNGLYWHSDIGSNGRIDKNYHLEKTKMCNDQNIELIHIFEDEWLNKQPIVKSILKNKLGLIQNKIFARKCSIKQVPPSEANQFLNATHLQGSDKSSIRLGLYFNKSLVSIMTFGKPRFNKTSEYELIRFSSILDTNVIGGASKLFKYFLKTYSPSSIVTYADRRYSCGNLYKQLGFKQTKINHPAYYYINLKEGCTTRYSRIAFQKHKLSSILIQYDKNKSEVENMHSARYARVWDCGTLTYIWS